MICLPDELNEIICARNEMNGFLIKVDEWLCCPESFQSWETLDPFLDQPVHLKAHRMY